jgi:hypothetical protein
VDGVVNISADSAVKVLGCSNDLLGSLVRPIRGDCDIAARIKAFGETPRSIQCRHPHCFSCDVSISSALGGRLERGEWLSKLTARRQVR